MLCYSMIKRTGKPVLFYPDNTLFSFYKLYTMDIIEQLGIFCRVAQLSQIRVGDRVHLHSMNGMYTVSFLYEKGFEITCNKWITQGRLPMYVENADFKCYAGGLNNL